MAEDKPFLLNKTIEDDFNWEKVYNNLKDEDFTSQVKEPTFEEFLNSGFAERTVLVSNVPVVDEKLLPKLHSAFMKLLRDLEKAEQIHIACQDGITTGLLIIVLPSKEIAEEYFEFLKGRYFDKKHKLNARKYSDLLSLKKVSQDNWQSSLVSIKFSMDDANEYLKNYDSEGFCAITKSESDTKLEYFTFSKNQNEFRSTEIEKGVLSAAKWSPKGTFMAVWGQQRVNLYIGPVNGNFKLVNTYPIPRVVYLKFSPDERFIAFSSIEGRRKKINIYDTISCQSYWHKSSIPSSSVIQLEWTPDSQKVIFVMDKCCTVFKSDEMTMLKSFVLPKEASNYEVLSNSMSIIYSKPLINDNGLNIFQKNLSDDSPDKLIKIIYSVKEASFYIQNKGLFLAIFSTKLVKKSTTFILDIADFTRKEVSIHTVELQQPVGKLIWEPCGNHFVVSSTEEVFFYEVQDTGVKLMSVMNVREARIEWCPTGKFLFFYYKKQNCFDMGFCNGHTGEVYKTYKTTYAEFCGWDSSGRYCSTMVSLNKTRSDNSVVIWGCAGSQIKYYPFKNLLSFIWRPRREILSEEQIKSALEKLPQLSKEFFERDKKFSILKAKEVKAFRSNSIMKFYGNLFQRRDLIVE